MVNVLEYKIGVHSDRKKGKIGLHIIQIGNKKLCSFSQTFLYLLCTNKSLPVCMEMSTWWNFVMNVFLGRTQFVC